MSNPRSSARGPLAGLAALLVATAAAAADPGAMPRPDELLPNVRFWTRIYSEIDGRGGLLHDSRELGVVYEVLRFPDGLSRRGREHRVERAKKRYRAALSSLASGKRSGLSSEERRVLALWPADVSNNTLRNAASRVRFQLGQADRFRAGLIREGSWREHIERVFEEHGLPPQLSALPHVESSYNPKAYSRVGAAGLWQFTRSTGRLFLRVDHVVDERMDPFAATVAAARLLAGNYRELGSWPLAITAYNHGVAGMRRAVRKLGTRDIGEIARRYQSRTFGFASRNFYAEFLAAWDVDREAERYFGPLHPDPPARFEEIEMDHFYPAATVANALGVDTATLREYNPALRPSVWNGAKYVPRGFMLRTPPGALFAPAGDLLASIPADQRMARQHRDTFYTVRRGDTLSRIARRYGVRERELVAVNNLRSRHRIRAGQVLRLPDRAGSRAPVVVARETTPDDGVYRVRRGDTLSIIARRFGVSEGQLAVWNNLRNRHRIAVGQRLLLREPTRVAVAVAPAEPAPPPRPAVSEAQPAPVAVVALETPPPEPQMRAAAPPEEPPAAVDGGVYGVDGERITVQADETLGHYAEWLGVTASRLRRLNGLKFGSPVAIGRRLRLDFRSSDPATFVNRRLQYHRTLQEEFFGAYKVSGTETHVLRRGDSLWELANQTYNVPVWLLRQYNPDLDFGALAPGQSMVIPRLEPRQS